MEKDMIERNVKIRRDLKNWNYLLKTCHRNLDV